MAVLADSVHHVGASQGTGLTLIGNVGVAVAAAPSTTLAAAGVVGNTLYMPAINATAYEANQLAAAILPARTYTQTQKIGLNVYYAINNFFAHTGDELALLFGNVLNPKLAVEPTTLKIPAPTAPHVSVNGGYTLVNSTTTNSQSSTQIAYGSSTNGSIRNIYTTNNITQLTGAGVQQYVDSSISALHQTLLMQIEAALTSITPGTNSGGGSGVASTFNGTSLNGIAITGSTFDNGGLTNSTLDNVTITNSSFSGGPINATSLNVSGNTILGPLTASSSLITGDEVINGNLTVNGTIFGGNLVGGGGGGDGAASFFVATSTTATSTFAGSINVGNGGFVYSTTTRRVGIGTTSPGATLGVNGSGLFTGNVTATNIVATACDACKCGYWQFNHHKCELNEPLCHQRCLQ